MSNIKLKQSAGSGTVTLKAAASGSNDVELTLPNDIGSDGQVLKLGSISAKTGTLSFGDVSVGGATGTDYNDSVKARFGTTDNDLEIYHDGDDSYISNTSNTDLIIRNLGNAGITIKPQNSYPVELHYNGAKQCETSANGLAFPSGKGIDFSATADTSATGASASSELFADYEEGSWTPTLAEGSATYTKCKYVRVGNMCWINFHCSAVTDRTSSTDWRIAAASLPFSPDTDFTDNIILSIVAHRYTSHANNATIHAYMNGSGVGWTSSNDTEGDDAFSAFKHEHVDQTYSDFHFSGWYYI